MNTFDVVTTIISLVIAAAALWVAWQTKRRQADPGQPRLTWVRITFTVKLERDRGRPKRP